MTLYEMKQAFILGKTIFDLQLRVAYYARVSTDKEEQINSLENQVAFFEDYIKRNTNWTFVRGYVDEGISGTTSLKRENFMQMIEDGRNKEFNLIVAKEVSRFSRDTIDSLLYTRKLLEYDVCVYFLSDNIVTASNDGELRLTIMSSMAQDEVRKISERTKFGFKRALEKGTVLGTDNIWGYKKDKGKLIIDEEEAPLIKDVFDMYANDDKIGLKKLSTLLKEKGYCNHNGNPIHQNTLKRIIQNPKYKGYYTGGLSTVVDYRSKKRNFNDRDKWKIYKDYEKVPPIVSEELWEKANQKLLSRSKSAAMYQKKQTLYPLSGKIYCDKHECGFVRRIVHYKNKGDIVYWYCSDFHKSGRKKCMPGKFREQDLYDILLSVFKTYEVYKEEICKELLGFYNEISKEDNFNQQESKLQGEIKALEGKKEKLLDLTLDGFLSKEELRAKKMTIDNRLEQIKVNLKRIQGKKVKKKDKKNKNFQLKKSIMEELDITQENLESYIEGLLDKIIVVQNDARGDDDKTKGIECRSKEKVEIKKDNNESAQEKRKCRSENNEEPEAELKIILCGNNIINYGTSQKSMKISQIMQNKVADLKNQPLCHSHAHS